jgi:hypothetical protein
VENGKGRMVQIEVHEEGIVLKEGEASLQISFDEVPDLITNLARQLQTPQYLLHFQNSLRSEQKISTPNEKIV